MNEKLNLCEILKGHEGETFYSPIAGNIILKQVSNNSDFENPLIFKDANNTLVTFKANGCYVSIFKNAEPVLFPSKNQRDWNKWLEEQKSKVPKTWHEYKTIHYNNINNGYGDYSIDISGNRCEGWVRRNTSIEKSALALIKIHQLIEAGYGGNTDKTKEFYSISYDILAEKFIVQNYKGIIYDNFIISFHNKNQAEEFLSYPENVQLLKDYFMI